MTTKKTTTKQATAQLRPLDLKVMSLKINGVTALICHAWDEKSKRQMRDKQMKKKAAPRTAKDPEQDFIGSLYHLSEDGYGFPAVGFKAAMVRASKTMDGMTMTDTRQMFHILADDGDLVKINGTPTMREDMVRVGMGTADIRYRGEFREWSAVLNFQYNASTISQQQIVDLLQLAGFSVGVGEWRPEKNGTFGRFEIVTG